MLIAHIRKHVLYTCIPTVCRELLYHFNSSGALLWARSTAACYGQSVKLDGNGIVLAAEYTAGSVDDHPYAGAAADIVVRQYSLNGVLPST